MSVTAGDVSGSLSSRLDRAEADLQDFCDAASLTETCLELLVRARAELAAGRLAEAQGLAVRIECLLTRARKSRETLSRWGPLIGFYEVAFLLVLVWMMLGGGAGWRLLGGPSPDWVPPVGCSVWGALGGVVAGLFGLYLHAAMRDFDRGHVPYYFLKPIVGLVLGPVMYLFARAGLLATQVDAAAIDRPELLYLGAFVLGFGERFSLRLIDRVAAAIFGPTEPPQTGREVEAREPTPGGGLEPPPPPTPTRPQLRVRVTGPDDHSDVAATLVGREGPVAVKGPPPDEGADFLFSGLAAGTYEVQVSKPGWRQVGPQTAELEGVGATDEVEVSLEPETGPAD